MFLTNLNKKSLVTLGTTLVYSNIIYYIVLRKFHIRALTIDSYMFNKIWPQSSVFFYVKSQPCHWRNAKSVSKRSTDVEVATTPAALSQNINLFQSLRVLQEGENSEDASALSNSEFKNYYYYYTYYTRRHNLPKFFQLLYKLFYSIHSIQCNIVHLEWWKRSVFKTSKLYFLKS